MAAQDPEFADLLRRVRAGCPEAAAELYERYSDYLRRIIRSRLGSTLRRHYDSLDFVQSVWGSFLRIPLDCRTFNTADDLVAFLARVAYNKMVDVYRRRVRSDPRAVNTREVPLDTEGEGLPDADGEPSLNPLAFLDPRPSPCQVAIALERWEQLVSQLPPELRRIVELRRDGYTCREVAAQLGLSSKFVQRFLQKLNRRVNPS
jgi:RNA polymerase sigma factor (sigma-70 family)